LQQLAQHVPFRHVPQSARFLSCSLDRVGKRLFEPALLFSQTDRPYRLLHELTQWSTTAKNQDQENRILRDLVRGRFEDLAREFSSDEEFRDDMLRVHVTALLICLHRRCICGAPTLKCAATFIRFLQDRHPEFSPIMSPY
jgi:hypothetical protein